MTEADEKRRSNALSLVEEALGLFASAIKCGEPWTATCEEVRSRAWLALKEERARSEVLAAENERLTKLVYVPGHRHCAKCGLYRGSSILNTATGRVSANTGQVDEKCPNCDVPLWLVTEREAGDQSDLCSEAYLSRAEYAEVRVAVLETALRRADQLCTEALPQFDWGKSALDANALALLNSVPGEIAAALSVAASPTGGDDNG